jgi:Uma2 family endonuclease
MDTQLNEDSLSVAQYLAGERVSEIRHEYINGRVHAMVGASDRHNLIAGNVFVLLRQLANPRGCQVFISDMKVYLNIGGEDILYYPDVMVACDPDDREPYFRRNPCLVVEVLSPATERIDRREKFLAYTTLPSLKEYLLVCQDQPRVTLFQRRDNWQAHIFGPGNRLELDCLEGAIEVDAVYETLDFNEG